MQSRKNILQFLSVLVGLVFFAGSAGITTIIHNCDHCGDLSVSSGIFLSPSIPEDNCCEYADNHHTSDGLIEFTEDGCHFKIDRMKLVNYVPVVTSNTPGLPYIPFSNNLPLLNAQNEGITIPLTLHNKHGGRYMITYNCQYLS